VNIGQARSVALMLVAVVQCGQAPDADPVIRDPPFLLKAKCRYAPAIGCICGTVFPDTLSFDDLTFLVQMLVDGQETWLSKDQRWLDQKMAERFLSKWRAECRTEPQLTPTVSPMGSLEPRPLPGWIEGKPNPLIDPDAKPH
jgi:hypothetical protein